MSPLARWTDMTDGSLELADVQEMHRVMDEVEAELEQQ